MKNLVKFLFLACTCLGTSLSLAQQTITKNFKSDFGAKGDGVTDDSKAWSDAIAFFNEQKKGTLIIPKGVYRVGTQTLDSSASNGVPYAVSKYKNTTLSNIDGLTIQGTLDKTGKIASILKYHDNVRYGFFDPTTGGEPKDASVESQASPGSLLTVIYNCKNITIKDLELDGNITKGVYHPVPKGMRGPDLIFIGISSYGARNLLIQNVYAHHFGLDGFYIQTPKDSLKAGQFHTVLKRCVSEYNGRQGLSYTAGSYLKVTNSTFRYTGMGGVRISPGANVDVENHDRTHKALSESLFENCVISSNKGGSGSLNIAGNVNNVTFKNCTIDAGKKIPGTNRFYAVQMVFSPSRNVKFDGCELTGNFLMFKKGKVMDENGMTVFKNCTFKDNSLVNDAQTKQPLIHVYDKVKFEQCTFQISPEKKLIESAALTNNAGSEQPVVIQNSKVVDLKSKKLIKDRAKFQTQRVVFQ